jgi:site-specific DNA recombinase
VQAGVRVFFYLEDRERTLDSPTDKVMLSLAAFADELEREKARQRTYDAMQRKAKAGHVTGGRVFGYDNVEMLGADGKRSHVERRINEEQAAVVRRIFALCADGDGLTRITKTLNEAGCPAPRAQQGRPHAWTGSTVRDVLQRELYRGVIVWNQTKKRDRWGQHRQQARQEAEWLRVPAPHLRIVSDALWTAAHARFAERQRKHTTSGTYRRRLDVDSPYLLSGFARCATCGGSFAVHTRQHGGARVPFYGCASFWKRGARVCPNNLLAPLHGVDEEVLATMRDDVFRPSIVEEAIRLALADLTPARQSAGRQKLERELSTVQAECERLADAIARGGPLEVLLERLRARQARRVAIEEELSVGRTCPCYASPEGLEERLQAKLADWRGLLTRNVQEGRAVLRTLLMTPLRFTPVNEPRRRGYAFEGTIALDRVLAGVLELPPLVASPAGPDRRWKLRGDTREAA